MVVPPATLPKLCARVAPQAGSPVALNWAIDSVRKGGTVSVMGAYGPLFSAVKFGDAMNKGLTIKLGQTHVQRYTKPLLEKIVAGEIDPSFVVTHPAGLEDTPEMYKKFRDKKDGVIKMVLRPGGTL